MPGSENIIFRSFKIVGNKAEFKNQRHFGLGFIDTTNGIADRMIVDYINFDPESAKSFGTMGYNIATLRATKIKILGGSFEYGGYECVGVADESRDVLIDGVYSGVGWRTSLQVHRDCVNVQVVNCRIEQDHINGHSALTVHGEPGTEVDSLLIANNKISAIVASSLDAQGGIQFVTKHTKNIQVANNTVTSTNRGIMIRGVNCQINSNLVNSEFHAVDLEGEKIIMANNILENRRSESIYIGTDSTEIFINSNQIKSEAHGIFTGHRCKTIKIVDNTVIVGTGYCFYSGQDRIILDLTISGNVFENNSQQTIALDYRGAEQLTPNRTISSNIISGSLNHRAILINANIKNPILIGNIIKKSQVGIRIANGCDYALIMSNDVSRATTPIEIVGTSNNIRQFNLEK